MTKRDQQLAELLTRGVEDVIVREELEKALKSGKHLRVKLGIDPTGPRIHLGYASALWKLKQFQDLGHQIVLIIGDFTAQIGDTSDKTSQRPMLTREDVKQNMRTYVKQIGKILDMEKVEVRYNSEWYDRIKLDDFITLTSNFTIQQMIERENFKLRLDAGRPIGLHETLYPTLQGYDSVMVHADVEIGATEQLFNVLAGRVLQKAAGQKPQNVVTLSILEGLDGRKMSKSYGNTIDVEDTPVDMYGKVMSLRDELIPQYFRICTTVPLDVIEAVEQDMARGANPRDTKASLAREIVARYYGEKAALAAEEAWNKQFRDGETPSDIDEYKADDKELADPVGLLANAFGVTKSEIRRLLEQGGIRIDGEVVESLENVRLRSGQIAQLGKRRFVKVQV